MTRATAVRPGTMTDTVGACDAASRGGASVPPLNIVQATMIATNAAAHAENQHPPAAARIVDNHKRVGAFDGGFAVHSFLPIHLPVGQLY